MRILRVAQKVYPDTKGGGQYHVHAISRDQAEMGHDVTVLTTRDHEGLPRTENRKGYTVVRVESGVTVAGNDISPALARYLWSNVDDFDIVHAHSHIYFATNVAALVRRIGDVPLAITNHGIFSQSAPERVFRWYLRTLGRWTFNQADKVFCYTETDRNRLQQLGVRSQIEVIQNGIDTQRFTVEGPTSDLVDSSGPVILFVGRLVKGKRARDVVEAFLTVNEEFPESSLVICGDGPLRMKLEGLTEELGVEDRTTFLGHVPYDEMPAIYRGADMLVLPSRAEGTPRTVLEAMASGLPVIGSRLPHTEDLIANGGTTVEVGDIAGFSEKILEMLSDREKRIKLGRSGRNFVREWHRWEDTVARTTRALVRIGERK